MGCEHEPSTLRSAFSGELQERGRREEPTHVLCVMISPLLGAEDLLLGQLVEGREG